VAESDSASLGGMQMVNPHLTDSGQAPAYRTVTATRPAVLPGAPAPLEVAIAGAGRMWDLEGWNTTTHGTSLLVVDRGRLVHEWYAGGLGPTDLFLGASMTKSALAHLVGAAVGSGALRVEDQVIDHVPELASSGYAACTVLDVLTMTSGVRWVEDYRTPSGLATRFIASFFGSGQASRDLLAEIEPQDPPGTRFEYCTPDSQVLDWVRERATGAAYDEALGELWATLGCEQDAVVGTDAAGVPMAGGSLAATSRDWARMGTLQLTGDPWWIELTSVPRAPFLRPGRLPSSLTTHVGFGGHWWPLDDAGRRVTADGSRGQFTYVDRDLEVVVVKTSQWPYDDFLVDRQARDLSYLGLPEIARAATR